MLVQRYGTWRAFCLIVCNCNITHASNRFLNQARAGQRLAFTRFLKIAFVWEVNMHVYVSVPKSINNLWRDMDPV